MSRRVVPFLVLIAALTCPAYGQFPSITSLSPPSALNGSGALTLTVNGTNFTANTQVNFNGAFWPTTFVSSQQLMAAIPASELLFLGDVNVLTQDPVLGGSNLVNFWIYQKPVITWFGPPFTSTTGDTLTNGKLEVNGSGFGQLADVAVSFNGTVLTPFFSDTSLVAVKVPTSLLATAGSANVLVTNMNPEHTLSVNSDTVQYPIVPEPVISGLSVAGTSTGGNLISVNGTGFAPQPAIFICIYGSILTCPAAASSNGTQLSPQQGPIAEPPGSYVVSVEVCTSPAGLACFSLGNTVEWDVFNISSLSPSSAYAGSAGFTLTVNGAEFYGGTTVQWNGAALATTYVSPTQLTATVPASLLASAGTAGVTLSQSLGNRVASSNAATFTINPLPTDTVTTSLPGLSFSVDSKPYTAPQTFNWNPGDGHTIGTTSPQSGAAGTQYVFANWSDQGAQSHSVTAPSSNTTYTANFTTQYQLTVSGNTGGSVGPASGYYNAGQSVTLSATPNAGYVFSGWVGSGPGSYTGTNPGASVTMNGPITETAAFTALTAVSVATSPSGLSFTVDNTTYSSTQNFNWAPGDTSHTIATTSPQPGATGTQYVFANWSDGGAMSHSVTVPSSPTTYTATFTTQFQLTVTAGTGGTVGPANGYVNAGQSVTLSATPNAGYVFTGWTGAGPGSYTGTNAGASVTMNGPITETAAFTPLTGVAVGTSPSGLSFTVDNTTYMAAQNFNWTPGGPHTIATTSPQSGAAGTQYVFANWSDGGALSHPVTAPSSGTAYTASFTTQYQLTVNAGSGGTAGPSSGYINAGQTVTLSATPNAGYQFAGWTGTGPGSYTGATAGAMITMNGAITETAAFTPLTGVTVGTSPPGLSFTADSTTYTSAQNFTWTPGSQHPVSTTSPQSGPQSGAAGTQYVFAKWSDGGALSHSVTAPSSAAAYTASFTTQYQLTVSAGTGGTAGPSSGYYDAGSSVSLTATPNPGYTFSGWSGDASGTANPLSLTMNAPHTVTANFAASGSGSPGVISTQPSSGVLGAQSFTFQFGHSAGYQNLSVVNILINNFLDGRHACYLAYVLSTRTLLLVDDAGEAGGPYAGSVAVGDQSIIQNSQCAVGLTSAIGSGNTLTLVLTITFKPAFGGNRIQYLAARDGSGGNTDWQGMGVWQAPPAPSGVITVGAVSPARSAAAGGTAEVLEFSWADSKGGGDFGVLNVLVNNFIDGRHACYLAYVASSNTLYLVDDGGDAGGPFAGAMVLNGSANTIQNSQCAVSGTGSLAVSGNTLTLVLNLTFQPGFAGNRIVWAAGRDAAGGNNTDWQAVGTWTVQ